MSGVTIAVDADVLTMTVDGNLDERDVTAYLAAITAQNDRGRRFAFITAYPGDRPRKSSAGHRLESDWMKEHRQALRQHLVAVAFVHHSGPIRRQIERVAVSGAGRRLFGCQCRAFDQLDDARRWVDEQLAKP